jgi:probable biosynthetic protein (TIGR04098 family)
MSSIQVKLGIPQLSYHGLDQTWLFKTLGQIHWDLISDRPLFAGNERLYASFFFCELDFGAGQHQFFESDQLEIETDLYKVNRSIYQTKHRFFNNKNLGHATFETIFVKKTQGCSKLQKDIPDYKSDNIPIAIKNSVDEYKTVRQENCLVKDFNNFVNLQYNPESYFNCVKILYFANYLNLVSQSEFIHFPYIKSPIKNIKIYYFSNVNENETIKALTTKDGDVYVTLLTTGDRVLAKCIVEKNEDKCG